MYQFNYITYSLLYNANVTLILIQNNKNMSLTLLTREQLAKNKKMMYDEYKKEVKKAKRKKSEIKRELAAKYGYKSETSINTIIWEIEKNNGKKKKDTSLN